VLALSLTGGIEDRAWLIKSLACSITLLRIDLFPINGNRARARFSHRRQALLGSS
jgi:hypothetical protein